jgi:hypothetical protein
MEGVAPEPVALGSNVEADASEADGGAADADADALMETS